MQHYRVLVGWLLVALFTYVHGYALPSSSPAPQSELVRRANGPNAAAKAAGLKWFGSCYDGKVAGDAALMKYYNDPNFIGQLTPENSMKPSSIDQGGGKYNFGAGDAVVAQAKKTGATVRCHFLAGPDQNGASLGSLNGRAATLAYVDKYISAVMQHFGSACYSWDVVNEALTEQGGIRTNVPWTGKIGQDFVEQIFAIATKHAPAGVKLCYNDYNLESSPAKLQGALGLVSKIKAAGGRIDCIGFESHISTSYHPTLQSYVGSLSKVCSAGIEAPVTELDVANAGGGGEEAQAEAYSIAVKACVQAKCCPGVTVWGLSDKYGWLSGKQADLIDASGRTKSALSSVITALSGTSGGTRSSTTAAPATTNADSVAAPPTTTNTTGRPAPTTGNPGSTKPPTNVGPQRTTTNAPPFSPTSKQHKPPQMFQWGSKSASSSSKHGHRHRQRRRSQASSFTLE